MVRAKRINFDVGDELLERIDRARGVASRNAWLREAAELRLAGAPSSSAPKSRLESGAGGKSGLQSRPLSSAEAKAGVRVPK